MGCRPGDPLADIMYNLAMIEPLQEIKEAAPAILDAHYPGEVVGATAVAEAVAEAAGMNRSKGRSTS